jgi:hypothetical protein
MGREEDRDRADAAPPGFRPRAWAAGPPSWRRVVGWIFGDRDAIDQQGLLAERTLFPPPARDTARSGGEPPPAEPPAGSPDHHGR